MNKEIDVMILVACVVSVMLVMAGFAYIRIAPGSVVVPMQWSLSGKVNWYLPRFMAFGSIPTLAIALIAILAVTGAGDINEIALVTTLLTVCQAVHIALVFRWSKRQRG